MSVADIRKSYEVGSLNEADVKADPIEQFSNLVGRGASQ